MTFTYGLIATIILTIYSVIIAFTFMHDNPNAPGLTWKNFAIRFVALPFWVSVILGVIYGLGVVVELIIGVA